QVRSQCGSLIDGLAIFVNCRAPLGSINRGKETAPAQGHNAQSVVSQHLSCLRDVAPLESVAPHGYSADAGREKMFCGILNFPRLCRDRVDAQSREIRYGLGAHDKQL